MKFVIITHVPHIVAQNQYFAYAPYVREMNIWIKKVDELCVVAPESKFNKTAIDIHYEHKNIKFVPVANFDVLNLKGMLISIIKLPGICCNIYSAMKTADHIHLRCPGNMGLLGSLIQILFPKKTKTAKYAGNWDSKSKQPLSYKLQKWILSNTFLTRNMQVLVYGEWEESSKNIKSFFTATYYEVDKKPIVTKNLQNQINFAFVGSLVKGKKPLYAIQLVEALFKRGHNVTLSLYGDGKCRDELEHYIGKNNLENCISLKGNQTQDRVREEYEQCQFVILPSDSEGWPKAVAEGMFWGCVPVATQVSCVPLMLDYGNRGVLLEMNLEKDVAQLEILLQNEVDFLIKSQKASDWSRKYTLDVFEQEIEKLLKQ